MIFFMDGKIAIDIIELRFYVFDLFGARQTAWWGRVGDITT
jgi:hypothetical protein